MMPPSGKDVRELSDLEKWQIEEIRKGIAEADRGSSPAMRKLSRC